MKKTAFARLLGPVAVPTIPRGTDFRDAADLVSDAISEAASADPENFFRVLAAEPELIDRHDVIWTLGYLDDPRATPPLVAALRSKLDIVRHAAANGLTRRRGAALVEPLIAALRDPSPHVRDLVITALGRQRSARAVAPLREAASKRSNQRYAWIMKSIAAALAKLS